MAGGPRPILRGPRTFLRPAERDDVPTFLRWLSDADVGEGLATRAPWSRLAEEAWYDELQKTQGKTTWHFVICLRQDERPIGFCALHDISHVNGVAELGIGIGETAEWDRGYGTETMHVLLDFAFGELRLHRVQLRVWSFNERAIHVYTRLGFRHEVRCREAHYRHGRWHDVLYMSMLANEWVALDRPRGWEID